MNYYSDESEWQWLFKNAINWDKILPLYYPTYPTEDGLNNKEEVIDFLSELESNVGAWCGSSVAAMAETFDREGAGHVDEKGRTIPNETLLKLYREAAELGVTAINLPREWGGMETPISLHIINLGFLSRAYIGACAQLSFFNAVADMIYRFCSDEFKQKYIPQIINGKSSGAMVMTEPGAGSDLGSMRATAKKQSDGTYLINGTKMFITNAGGGVAFVLARTGAADSGLAGLSMFFVEHILDDGTVNFRISKNEDKMGLHGSFTCEVLFENSISHLVGKEGDGFTYMLELMNEARICTGVQALGGIEASISYAKQYASERVQFGKPVAELPLMKRNLADFETERDALRAMIVDTISHYDIYHRLLTKKGITGDLSDAEEATFKDAKMWTRKRTPLVKYYATEAYVTLSQKAIQVLGGYGFMREYPVERLHRDSFGPILYEGTSQIQALMAMKDFLKYTMKNPQAFFASILAKHPTRQFVSNAPACEKEFQSTHYEFKKNTLKLLVKCLRPETSELLDIKKWQSEENIEKLMTHAETLCQGLSYMETLRVLANHAAKDETRYDLFNRYHILVRPRLEGIYADWSLR